MHRLRFTAGMVAVALVAALLVPGLAAAQEQPVLLDRPLIGRLGPGGQFAYYQFAYPADGSTVTVNLQVAPDNPAVLKNAGFLVYAPDGRLLVRGGAQHGLSPNVAADVSTSDAAVRGTLVVQVYNYDPTTPVDYTVWVTGAVGPSAPAAPPPAAAGVPVPAAACEFRFGFAALAARIPQVVGACLESEHPNPVTGETLQRTTNGLLVWRAADNATGFTDGYRTWLIGPYGLQTRLNTEHFPWESPAPIARPVPRPVVSFSVDGRTVAAGQCTTARWSVADASAVYLLGAGADTVAQPLSGQRQVCPAASTTYTLSVVDLAGGRSPHPIDVAVQGYAAPTVSFWADRSAIALGECTTVRWSVEHVRAVYLRTPDGYYGVVGQGERVVCPRATSTYTLDVVDLAGATSPRAITVEVLGQVAPTVSFWADRTAVNPGECTTLRWDVLHVRAVYLRTPEGYYGVAGLGERGVCPRTTFTYSLDVVDLAGTTTPHTITVAVQGHATPTVSFWADRMVIGPGECTAIRWSVANVRAVYLRTPESRTGVVGQGDRGVCPRATTTYGLEVVDFADATTIYAVTINVRT